MIWNIVDNRIRKYRWKNINAVIEPTWHDNSCQDTDLAEQHADEIEYDEREAVSLQQAVAWANSVPYPVTLYLFDEGQGTAAMGN